MKHQTLNGQNHSPPPSRPTTPGDFDTFSADFTAAATDPAPIADIQLSFVAAWQLLGTIQLACKHPDFPETHKQRMQILGRHLQGAVSLTPVLARIAESGWSHDAN